MTKSIHYLLRVLFFSLLVLFKYGESDGGTLVDTLNQTIWDNRFGEGDYLYKNRVLAISPKDSSLFIAGTYFPSEKGRSQKEAIGIWVWKINNDGEKVLDLRLNNNQDQERKFKDVEAMAIQNDESIILVVRLENKQSELIKLDTNGKILISNKIGEGRHIFKIFQTMDEKFLLIGNDRQDSFMMQIDKLGNLLWSKISDRGKSESFVDGISTEDGGFVIIENSGKVEQFFMGASDIWMLKYDSKGEKKFEKSFSGRYGNIKSSNGKYAIVYDKSSIASQEVWVKVLDVNFEELWNVNVKSVNFGLERFKIASFNDNFIVAGPLNGRPWVSAIDAKGIIKWEFSGVTMDVAIGTDFISANNNCFILSSVVALNSNKLMNNKIRVIKFLPE